MSSRRKSVVRLFVPSREVGIWEDQTVTGFYGGGKPTQVVKRVIHGYLREVGHLTQEAIDDGARPPVHDHIVYLPHDFSVVYLKRN